MSNAWNDLVQRQAEAIEERFRVPKVRCKVTGKTLPDVNNPPADLDEWLHAHNVEVYREAVRELLKIIDNAQRHHHDPLVELGRQTWYDKYGAMFR